MSRRHKTTKHKGTKSSWFKERLSRPIVYFLLFSLIGSILVYASFAADSSGEPGVGHNPTISEKCGGGLDIALVADVSGSIWDNQQYVNDIQTAYNDFINGLLPKTKSEFSMTQFDDNAEVLQSFTNNVTLLHNAVNNMNGGGGTNWVAGLTTGYNTFSGENNGKPKLLIIATDGDPNEPGGGGGGGYYGGGGGGNTTALYDAMDEANTIKAAGIHILAVGIGSDPTIQNLEDITGTNLNTGGINSDVITSDYSTFAATMRSIAGATCGTGTGTGGNGKGSNGNGNGIGGTGNGSKGSGKGSKGSGQGTSTGGAPKPSPTPSPAPAAKVPNKQPNPAPKPQSQGTQTQTPQPPPSPFFDGKQFAPGSTPDSLANTVVTHSLSVWWYAFIAAAVIGLGAGSVLVWRKRAAILEKSKPKK